MKIKQNIVFLFPGQASQYVGMGRDLYENSVAAAQVMDRVAAMDGLKAVPELCFQGPEELLTRTDNVQPAITAVSLMALAAIHEAIEQQGNIELKSRLKACAGHSLGEYSAHVAAGNLTESTVMNLVCWRGRWMNEAAQPPNLAGAMVAVMGLEIGVLRKIISDIGHSKIAIANLNSPGQIILSGTVAAIAEAVIRSVERGAKKTVMLNVSGAWHSPLMRSAEVRMKELIDEELTADNVSMNGAPYVVANVTATEVRHHKEVKRTLIRQISSLVNWEYSVRKLCDIASGQAVIEGEAADPPLFVEIGPGKVLRGLMRSIDRSLEVVNVEDMAGVEKLMGRLE